MVYLTRHLRTATLMLINDTKESGSASRSTVAAVFEQGRALRLLEGVETANTFGSNVPVGIFGDEGIVT